MTLALYGMRYLYCTGTFMHVTRLKMNMPRSRLRVADDTTNLKCSILIGLFLWGNAGVSGPVADLQLSDIPLSFSYT